MIPSCGQARVTKRSARCCCRTSKATVRMSARVRSRARAARRAAAGPGRDCSGAQHLGGPGHRRLTAGVRAAQHHAGGVGPVPARDRRTAGRRSAAERARGPARTPPAAREWFLSRPIDARARRCVALRVRKSCCWAHSTFTTRSPWSPVSNVSRPSVVVLSSRTWWSKRTMRPPPEVTTVPDTSSSEPTRTSCW